MTRTVLTILISAWLAACATTANVDYDKHYNFADIHTVSISTPTTTGTDTRINSPLVAQRVHDAIASILTGRGLQVVDGAADAVVSYQLLSKAGIESYDTSVTLGYGHFHRNSLIGLGYGFPIGEVESYDEAVLTIDFHDAPAGRLLWRGSSTERLGDGYTPEKLDELVVELVTDTLQQYPPGHTQ